jgi:hypothetical protein
MEGFEDGCIQLELKYCERCGALWLRPKGSDLVFCASCALSMAGFEPRSRALELRIRSLACFESSFWTEGGNA